MEPVEIDYKNYDEQQNLRESVSSRGSMADVWIPKSARASRTLFSPVPDRTCQVTDYPSDKMRNYSLQSLGSKYNNSTPYEPAERERPITELESAHIVNPTLPENLYAKDNVPVVYEGNPVAPAASQISKRKYDDFTVGKNRPEKTYELGSCLDNMSQPTGLYQKPVMDPEFSTVTTMRTCTDMNNAWYGPGQSNVDRDSGYQRTKKGEMRPTIDNSCDTAGILNASGKQARQKDNYDAPKLTKKQWLVLHPRTFGNLESTIPEKMQLSALDLPKTTLKETSIHDTVDGVVTGIQGPRKQYEDVARSTTKETTQSRGQGLLNASAGYRQRKYIDLDEVKRNLDMTQRSTMDKNGVRLGLPSGSLVQSNEASRIPALKKTMKDGTLFSWLGQAGASLIFKQSVESMAEWLVSPVKNILESKSRRSFVRRGPETRPGYGETRLDDRITGDGRVQNVNASGATRYSCNRGEYVNFTNLEERCNDDRFMTELSAVQSQTDSNPFAVKSFQEQISVSL